MKVCLFIFFTAILSNTSFGQSANDEQLVKNVVLAYQEDYNDGGFKNVESYTTKDWEHINPIGGITKGRDSVMNELRPSIAPISLSYKSKTCGYQSGRQDSNLMTEWLKGVA